MIAIKRKDGGVSILHDGSYDPKSVPDILRKWREAQTVRLGHDNFIAAEEVESIPDDRYFRSAWVANGEVSVDMPKARDVLREKMRVARAPLLAALDIEQMRGRNVEAQKQALRDVTSNPAIDSASTPEELKATWPAILG